MKEKYLTSDELAVELVRMAEVASFEDACVLLASALRLSKEVGYGQPFIKVVTRNDKELAKWLASPAYDEFVKAHRGETP